MERSMNHPSPSFYWNLSHPDRYLFNFFLKISNDWDCTGLASKSSLPFSFVTWKVSPHIETKASSTAFSDHIYFLASPQWAWRMRHALSLQHPLTTAACNNLLAHLPSVVFSWKTVCSIFLPWFCFWDQGTILRKIVMEKESRACGKEMTTWAPSTVLQQRLDLFVENVKRRVDKTASVYTSRFHI